MLASTASQWVSELSFPPALMTAHEYMFEEFKLEHLPTQNGNPEENWIEEGGNLALSSASQK